MHLPAKIRTERENTFPEISVTYICEQTRSQAHTHKLMSCQSPLLFIVFISCWIACLFKQSIHWELMVVQWAPEDSLCCPPSIASGLQDIPGINNYINIIIRVYVEYTACITVYVLHSVFLCASWKANDPDITFFRVKSGSSPSLYFHSISSLPCSWHGSTLERMWQWRPLICVRTVMCFWGFGV